MFTRECCIPFTWGPSSRTSEFPLPGSWLIGRWRSWQRCGRAIPVLLLKFKVLPFPEFCVFDTGSAQQRSLNLLRSSLISALPWKGEHCNQNVEGKKLQIKFHIVCTNISCISTCYTNSHLCYTPPYSDPACSWQLLQLAIMSRLVRDLVFHRNG